MRETVRLTFKQFRFEALAIGGSLLLLALVLAGVAVRLHGIGATACAGTERPADCPARLAEADGLFQAVFVGQLLAAVLPVFGAIVLGVMVVGREVERATATLAWPLARSRRRWLSRRWLVVAVAVAGTSLVVGVAADALLGAYQPADPARTFVMVDLRGWIVPVRAVAAFTLAVLAGALFGRTLPALLVAMIASFALVLAVNGAMGSWADSQAVALDLSAVNDARVVDTDWRDVTTGQVMTRREYLAVTPPPDAPADWDAVTFEPIPIGVPGDRAGDYLAVEALILVGGTLLLLAGALEVVERRPPY